MYNCYLYIICIYKYKQSPPIYLQLHSSPLRLPSLRTTLTKRTSNVVMHLIQLTCLNYSLRYRTDEVPSSIYLYYVHAVVTRTAASAVATTWYCDHLAAPPPQNSAIISNKFSFISSYGKLRDVRTKIRYIQRTTTTKQFYFSIIFKSSVKCMSND